MPEPGQGAACVRGIQKEKTRNKKIHKFVNFVLYILPILFFVDLRFYGYIEIYVLQ
jgi:hypothetical protein